jgi:hypothetical protein
LCDKGQTLFECGGWTNAALVDKEKKSLHTLEGIPAVLEAFSFRQTAPLPAKIIQCFFFGQPQV